VIVQLKDEIASDVQFSLAEFRKIKLKVQTVKEAI